MSDVTVHEGRAVGRPRKSENMTVLSDREFQMREALVWARAWVEHWNEDRKCGLIPTEESLQSAHAMLTSALAKSEGI